MKIAIIKPSALGDICHALPVLTALRERYPQAHLSWVVNRSFEPLLSGHPHLNATIPFDRGLLKRGLTSALTGSLALLKRLRRERFDLVVDLQGLLRTGLMTAATRAPRRIGFANAREGARHFYTERIDVPDADSIHAVDRYWRIAEYLDAGQRPKRFIVPIPPDEQAAVSQDLGSFPRPWSAVAVGAKWVTKRWRPSHFTDLLTRVQSHFGGTVLFVGIADDAADSESIRTALPGPAVNLCGRTSLPRLAAVLTLSDVAIMNDTGPLHLAAALGIPCVAPYTCTKTIRHGPYTSPGGGLETRVACAGSYLKQCPNHMICMNDLTAESLWPRLREVMQTWSQRSRSA